MPEPEDLRSQNGTLEVSLTIRNSIEKGGSVRYCYLLPDGSQSPTLRLHRGDVLILHLKNELRVLENHSAATSPGTAAHTHAGKTAKADPCASMAMALTSTALKAAL